MIILISQLTVLITLTPEDSQCHKEDIKCIEQKLMLDSALDTAVLRTDLMWTSSLFKLVPDTDIAIITQFTGFLCNRRQWTGHHIRDKVKTNQA